MTASTDQERQEFEEWAVEEGLHIDRNKYGCEERYASISTQSAFRGWQAKSRAQVVPKGWKLVPEEPTPAMYDRVMREGYYHDDPKAVKAVLRAEYQDMLAAAPQPPEAACNQSMQPELATLAAPVQLPEPAVPFAVFDCHGFYTEKPNAKQAQAFCDHYNKRDADGGGSAPYTVQALYTEHQVRQLLAAHNIKPKP